MKKDKIYDFRLISENAPPKYIVSVLSALDVCNSAEKFFSENFRGAILLDLPESTDGYVIASPDGIAYFFKVLLNAVFGNSTVKIKMRCDGDFLKLTTEWKRCDKISDADIKELERTARLSGFGFEISEDGAFSHVDIFLSIQTLSYLHLYAVDTKNMHEAFVRVFFLI